MPRIDITPKAEQDLTIIWKYIAKENLPAASRLERKIESRLKSLSRMPLSGDLFPTKHRQLRRSAVGNYVIYYLPHDNGIEVIRILHGARDINKLL